MFEAQNDGPPEYAKAKFLDLLFSASESLGMESRDLLRRAGLNSVSRRGPPGLVPFEQAVALYDAATHTLGDTGLIPNMVARLPKASDLRVPGFTLLTAPSLKRVVDCLPSVYHSQTRRGSWQPRHEGSNCILAWRDRHLTQGLAACNEANVLHLITVMLRDICGEAVPVQSVSFRHAALGTNVGRHFPCRVTFGAAETAVVLPRDALDMVPRLAHAAMHQHFCMTLAEQPALLGPMTLQNRLQDRVIERLGSASLSAAALAKDLGLTERTLRRRLASLSSSVTLEIERARQRQALRLLTTTTQSIGEIALNLGFAEVSSFTRACRRWFGKSPTVLRAEANHF